ncbi:hypothetical protein GCM10028801_31250 [Nocardioides maradonensis]
MAATPATTAWASDRSPRAYGPVRTNVIRTRKTDWRVQVCDDEGRWYDYHVGHRASQAFIAYHRITGPNKRLLRNGEPLRISHEESTQPSLWEAG